MVGKISRPDPMAALMPYQGLQVTELRLSLLAQVSGAWAFRTAVVKLANTMLCKAFMPGYMFKLPEPTGDGFGGMDAFGVKLEYDILAA